MVNLTLQYELFSEFIYGLSLSESESQILGKALPLYVKKLNCISAAVIQKKDQLRIIQVLPAVLAKAKIWDELGKQIEEYKSETQPFQYFHIEKTHFYIYGLANYGHLILGRRMQFDSNLAAELAPIFQFLGRNLIQAIDRQLRIEFEEKLEQERNLLRTIIDNIPLKIYAKDVGGRKTLANKHEIEALGLSTEKEILGKSDYDLYNEKIAKESNQEDQIVLDRGESILNHKKQSVDNSWSLISKIPLFDSQGNVNGLVGISLDITNRKQTEEQIKIQEEKYRSIIANMNLGLLEVDDEEKIIYANQSFCKMTGYSLQEMKGKIASQLFAEGQSLDTIQQKNEERKSGSSDAYEVQLKDKWGNTKWWLISGAPRYNEKGQPVGSIGIHLDITEQKQLEYDLIESREEARKLAKTKQSFLANMSHEIRTPMNAIIGMANQLQKTDLNSSQSNLLNIIQKASDNLLVIINDILDIAKLEDGKLALHSTIFELQETISDCIQTLQFKAEEKGILLKKGKFDSKIARYLKGDSSRLRQILLNFLSNAVKFTEKGGVTIECFLSQSSYHTQWIECKIIDTGIGMESAFLQTIFDPFTQESTGNTKNIVGTGLGMYISKQLIELMQGTVSITSAKNIGTTISFKIPFTIAEKPPTKSETVKSIIQPNQLNGRKILIVDDNEMNRLVAEMIINQNGAIAIHAENGEQAIEVFKKENPDLILMDLQMPIMNGYEATEYLRTHFNSNIPIIALTANAIKGEKENCLKAGMNDYISKPFKELDLIQSIAQLITTSKYDSANSAETINESKINSPSFDLSILLQMSRNDYSFVFKMIQLYCDDLPFQIEQMKEGLNQQNSQILAAKAHRLKPSTTNLGMPLITQQLKQIELLAKQNQFSHNLASLTQNCMKDLEKSREELLHFISENKNLLPPTHT